jgi:hypothetical protein
MISSASDSGRVIVGYTYQRVIHHIAIAGKHTSVIIFIGKRNYAACAIPNFPMQRNVKLIPSFVLVRAWKHENKPDIRAGNVTQFEYNRSREGVKSFRPAGKIISYTLLIKKHNLLFKAFRQF